MKRLWAALAAVALLGTACGSASADGTADGSTSGEPHSVHLTSAAGQRELLLRPAGNVRGLVVFMHGLGGDEEQLLSSTGLFPVRDALLAGGYAIVASNAHGDNAGNPVSVNDQLTAVADARRRLGDVRDVYVLAFSMGGLDALLVAASHRLTGLQALALISPATNQQDFVDTPFGNLIINAFDHPSPSQVPTILRNSDPVYQPAARYVGYRYRFWHSATDRTVPMSQSTNMIKLLASAGVDAPLIRLTGGHGILTALNPAAGLRLFATSTPSGESS